MKKLFALVLALSMLALAACGTTGNNSGTIATPGVPASTPPESPERVVVQFEALTKTVESDDGVTVLTYTVPQVTVTLDDADTAKKITDDINSMLTPDQAAIDELAGRASDAYAALDEAQRETWAPYGITVTAEVTRGDSSVLSLYCTRSQMSGGAHPANSSFGLNYDIATGDKLTAEQLASDTGMLEETVAGFVKEAAAGNENASAFYGVDDFANNALSGSSWYFSASGITVFADPEVIAPYAQGTVVFTVPYSSLTSSLKAAYFPDKLIGGDDAFTISSGANGTDVSAVIDEDGVGFKLTAMEDVTGVSIDRVSMGSDGEYLVSGQVLYVSRLASGEDLGLTAAFMDMPLYSVSWGSNEHLLIGDSGKDGSLLLMEP